MSKTDTLSPPTPHPDEAPAPRVGRGDAIFRTLTGGAGVLVVVLLGAIVVFLVAQAIPAFRASGIGFLSRREWFPDAKPARFGVAALAFGTIVSSVLALAIALPVAIGSALFTTEIAGPRLGRWIGHLMDLLAAVPSVVYGLWGVFVLIPHLKPASTVGHCSPRPSSWRS